MSNDERVETEYGYTCRCGNPIDCVCPSSFPELVAAEIGLSYREMRQKRDELSDELKRVTAERDAVLAGEHVPMSDLSACWRVASGYQVRAEKAEAAQDRVRKLADDWSAGRAPTAAAELRRAIEGGGDDAT